MLMSRVILSLEYGARAFGSIGQLLTRNQIHAASIAVPTVHHLDVARPLLEAGIDLLIEKPVAFSLEDTDELIAIAKKNQRVVQVGHLERFNPAVRATLPLITVPCF
jgi:predicted dehydrogenase